MKSFQLFLFIICINTSNLYAQKIQQAKQLTQEQVQTTQLQAICSIQIVKEKLLQANKSQEIDINQASLNLKKLYEKCSTIINTPDLPKLTEQDWVNKMIQEIFVLQKDHETKNCLNQAILKLKDLKETSPQAESFETIKEFFQTVNACTKQYTMNLSLSHLDTAIEGWNQNTSKNACNDFLRTLFLKNVPEQQDTFTKDAYHIYTQCACLQLNISFELFIKNIKRQIKILKNDPQGHACLQALMNFKQDYKTASTQEEKINLKKAFAIQYFQCKSRTQP